ncbi:MAG: hypothetical protein JXC32_21540 [Anaerolineae bacterium]|nr:hypothetical protein [Anaerolineae bacterium]
MDPRIHLAFRFHVNFYHSYRGDTPDELGFGKDIRVIRQIVAMLDRFNAQGLPIRGTWDIENVFSLGAIMPEHCPDLIAALQRRVQDNCDEIEVMSYNNGLISAHTAREFEAAIGRALSNAEGSGLRDLFSEVSPVVRPQEMMFTPLHLKLYRACGIEAISLFYSAVPFNAFSNFIPPLSLVERHNPLTLTYPGIEDTLTLIPAHNHGDVANHLSLRRWVTSLRRQQLGMVEPTDLLLLIDADADDDFWSGYDWPIVRRLLIAAQGLEGLVNSIAGLDYVTFTTPYAYVTAHPPVGTVSFGQDTADGNYDGMASWAEKWSNHRLWTGIDRSRILEQQARALMADAASPEVMADLNEAFEARLRALSTTHFGLAAPVMNQTRLGIAADLVTSAFEASNRAWALAAEAASPSPAKTPGTIRFALADYARGIDTEAVVYRPKPSRALVRLPLVLPDVSRGAANLSTTDGKKVPAALRHSPAGTGATHELCFVAELPAGGRVTHDLTLDHDSAASNALAALVRAHPDPLSLGNDGISLTFDRQGHPIVLRAGNATLQASPLLRTAIRYGPHLAAVEAWRIVSVEELGEGVLGVITAEGTIPVGRSGQAVRIRREYVLAAELPYLYVTTDIVYPKTPDHVRRPNVARRLERTYDDRWQEVMPCEIAPGLAGRRGHPLRIWKHNYLDHASAYDLSEGTFERAGGVDAFNNAITHGWLAASDGQNGLLVAHSADAATCFAFCPMRTRRTGDQTTLTLNPFGTYAGRQMAYPSAATGLGKHLAVLIAETLRSPAPSYAGHRERFLLMLAPYTGDGPPAQLQADAEAFAYPYAVLSTAPAVARPPHRRWSGEGLAAQEIAHA